MSAWVMGCVTSCFVQGLNGGQLLCGEHHDAQVASMCREQLSNATAKWVTTEQETHKKTALRQRISRE